MPNLTLAGSFADGTLHATSRHLLGPTPGINRDSVLYLRLRSDGSLLGKVGWRRRGNVDFLMGEFGPNIHDEPLGPTGSLAVVGTGVGHTDGQNAEITIRGADGVVTRLIRWTSTPVSITAADRERFGETQRLSTKEQLRTRQIEVWLPKASWPTTLPVTELLLSRKNGALLVADYCSLGARWCNGRDIDERGAIDRVVWIPVHATHAVVSGTQLVTVSTDEDGFEWLTAWTIFAAK